MSEYYHGCICFGGKITSKQFNDLVNLFLEDTAIVESDIITCLQANIPIHDALAKYGKFENVEDYCQQNNIDYDRQTEAFEKYSAENVYSRSDQEVITCKADSEGNPMCDMRELNNILKTYSNEDGNPDKNANVQSMFNEIKTLVIPVNIHDLGTLEVVD
jgi:hypothetical protein